MTTQQVANRLIELCRTGDYETVVKELYSPEIESVEPEGSQTPYVKGIDGIIKKGKEFNSMVEAVHSNEVSNPVVADNFFTCSMKMSVTMKGAPGPMVMEEICLYQVADGKVVKEQFFFTPAPVPA